MNGNYILDDDNIAHKEPNILAFGRWFEAADRTVAKTQVGEFLISTVFLGIDHQYGKGPPLLFETMVFKGDSGEDLDAMRYTTHVQALAGHDQMVAKVRESAESGGMLK